MHKETKAVGHVVSPLTPQPERAVIFEEMHVSYVAAYGITLERMHVATTGIL